MRTTAILLLAGIGAVAMQWPDLSRFSVAPVLLVCAGSVGFAAAAVILSFEPAQRGNAGLFALASVLFSLEWAFTWPHTPLPFLGLPLGQLFAVCLGVILLRYPYPRIQRRSDRWIVIAGAVFTVGARLLWAVTTEPEWFAFGIAGGHGHLPASTFWIVLDPSRRLSHAIAVGTDVGQLFVVPLFLTLIVRRVRRESRLVRTELLPVVIGTFLLGAVLVAHLVATLTTAYSPAAAPNEWISGALSLTVMIVPIAFIIAGVQRRLAAAAVSDLIIALSRSPSSADLQTALRTTLRDERLELLYRRPGTDDFVDVEGHRHPTSAIETEAGRAVVVPVFDPQRELLAVVRTGLDQQRHPSLLASAIAASALAIKNTRLEAELRAQLLELRDSRNRVVAATLAERRRLERDLHDGVQQQLLAIGATVGRLALREPPGASNALIDEIRDLLRTTQNEVRLLARGLYPAILTEAGLPVALAAAAERLPLEVTLDVPPGRWPPDVELTAYFVACEALTNCVVHSGSSTAHLSVRVAHGELVLRVADDGVGGARFAPTGGLSGLRDRARGLGGEVALRSAAGMGTVVELTLPCG